MFGRKDRLARRVFELEASVARKEDDLNALGNKLKNIGADRDAAVARVSQLQVEMKQLREQVEDLTDDNKELTNVVSTMHTTAEKLVADLAAAKKTEGNLRDRLSAENLKVTKLEAENRKLSDQVSNLMVQSDTAANAIVDGKHPTSKRPTIK